MSWGLGCPLASRTGLRRSASQTYQVWCPYVLQGPCPGAKQALAITLAAPSLAPGGSLGGRALLPDDANFTDCRAPARVVHEHPSSSILLSPELLADDASPSRDNSNSASDCDGHIVTSDQHHSPAWARSVSSHNAVDANVSSPLSPAAATRPGHLLHKSPSSGINRTCTSPSTDRTSSPASTSATTRDSSDKPNRPRSSRRTRNSKAPSTGTVGPPISHSPVDNAFGSIPAELSGASPLTLTLEQLRLKTPALHAADLASLQQRLQGLGFLLKLDDAGSLPLCDAVPGLLLADPTQLHSTWRHLRHTLGGEDAARSVCSKAPLLLVLPPQRMQDCIASLAAALALPPKKARALACEWPQLATLAPATLAAKLAGLQRLLGADASASDLAAAVRVAPRLLTFSTASLERHNDALTTLLGPARLHTALRQEPGLLLLRPETVATKLRLLQELLGCGQQPQAVAVLVVRQPSVLRRSLQALSRSCRALSIWHIPPRAKLHMCVSRPGLLTLPWHEVHGRCRWLRRLILSNGYYHAALRRLPPSVLAALLAALPSAWPRLQYLADSSQEGALGLMDAVECRQEAFKARFPEFGKWYDWKVKQMGTDNPWRGAFRIRGIGSAATPKPANGSPNQQNLVQQRQRHDLGVAKAARSARSAGPQAGPTVAVVMTEACEVRSGGSTVSRPRRVVQQALCFQPPTSAQQQQAQSAAQAENPSTAMGPGEAAAATSREGSTPLAAVGSVTATTGRRGGRGAAAKGRAAAAAADAGPGRQPTAVC